MSAGSLWNQICKKGSDKKCDYLTGNRQKNMAQNIWNEMDCVGGKRWGTLICNKNKYEMNVVS